MKKSITIATLVLTTALTANAGFFNDYNGSNWSPFNGDSNWGPLQGANNWVNDTDFGFNFNTKNKIDNQVSGRADSHEADTYAKGYTDAKNKYYFNETDYEFVPAGS